jgi:hypothetical protein
MMKYLSIGKMQINLTVLSFFIAVYGYTTQMPDLDTNLKKNSVIL